MSCLRPILRLAAWVFASTWTVLLPAAAAELRVPGSGNPEFVLGELAKAFNASQSRHKVSIPPSTGSAGAIRALEEQATPLARVGRPLKDEELRRGLNYIAIGRDPVVFVAGAGVTARNITPADALAIYAGRIDDWKALGGKPGPIRAIGRETTDASRAALGKHIRDFGSLNFGDNVKLAHLDPQVIELLDRYPTSLGFLNRSALFAAQTKLVLLSLDKVAATPETVAAGSYPVTLEFGLIHRHGELSDAAREFVEFVRSAAGDAILRRYGVLPAKH